MRREIVKRYGQNRLFPYFIGKPRRCFVLLVALTGILLYNCHSKSLM